MKRLIANNFLYYFKSKTKILISISFVLSFFVMLFVYDNLELKEIQKEAYSMRNQSHDYYPHNFSALYLDDVDHDEMIDRLTNIYVGLGDYGFLLASGRTNYHLTPQRQFLNQTYIDLYTLVGEHNLDFFPSFADIEILEIQNERYSSLLNNLIPDDFNAYTVTAANSLSRIFEGSFLLMIMGFTLLLFYDLFSKDFDSKTYRHLYTTSYPRSKIIIAKLLFAFLYLTLLLFIGTILLIVGLSLIRRSDYNVVASRIGDLRHLKLTNTNIFSTYSQNIHYGLVSNLTLNLFSLTVGVCMLMLWILLISYLSFKLKSSNNSLIIGIYILIAIFSINLTSIKDYFTFVFPLFGYEYRSSLYLESTLHPIHMIVLSLIYSSLLLVLLLRHVNAMDLLDGDNND